MVGMSSSDRRSDLPIGSLGLVLAAVGCQAFRVTRSLGFLAAAAILAGCSGGPGRAEVGFSEVEVSADRLTLTVTSTYSKRVFCAKEPDGLKVEVVEGVALITSYLRQADVDGTCSMECGFVTQTITLSEALPEGTSFASPDGIDPGCG